MKGSKTGAVVIERINDICLVKFARPETRNPLSVELLGELGRIVDEANRAAALILTGSGDVFASGADLREIAQVTAEIAP